ncbi:unnamed protein product [Leptidea sinapis]|uniref:Uncharacterized protein n=1 Tax=Leptidea sinapis TaxID=189913 RepID=A0A5E4Q0T8_9NEOP|nr:unnamed protein product [Leptidea sinapis]
MFLKVVNAVIVFTFIQTVQCQYEKLPLKPDKCMGNSDVMDRHCCIFPPFFSRDVSRECGARFSIREMNRAANITILRRESIKECDYWKCVLNRYAMLNPVGTVNEERFYSHLEKWTTLNPEFNTIIISAKTHCKQTFRMHTINY